MLPTNFMTYPRGHNAPPFDDGSLVYTPYQTSDGIPGVGSDGMFGSSHHPIVASPGPVNDLRLELAERQEMPLGAFSGDHGMNNWSYTNTQTYMRAGPTYDYPTRTATRAHSQSSQTHNRTSTSVSGYSLTTMHSPRGSPFNIQREVAVSDGRSFSLPPLGSAYPLPAADPQYSYSGYQLGAPSVSAETSFYPPDNSQWLTRTPSSQSCRDTTSTPPEVEATGVSLCQARVGSDRTRAISRARRTNPDKKLYHCPISGCGATITSKHNLKSHNNSHFGIRPHACGQGDCTKMFGTSAEAKRHRARHCSYRSG